MRASGVARLARRREADGRVARREGAAALDGFAARARVHDGVAGHALRHVGGQCWVVVDVVPFRRFGHDHQRAAFLRAGRVLGAEEHVGLGVGAARHDLVEFLVPEDADEWGARRHRGREFGFECRGVQDVEVAGLGACDDRGRVGCELDVGRGILA